MSKEIYIPAELLNLNSDPVDNPPSGYIYIYPKNGSLYTKDSTGNISPINVTGNTSLDDLTDVTINTASSGETLVYDNGIWVNSANTDLSNYYTITETDNNFLSANTSFSESSDTQVIYNSGGTLTGSSNFTYDGTNFLLSENLFVGGIFSARQGIENTQVIGENHTVALANIKSTVIGDSNILTSNSEREVVIGYSNSIDSSIGSGRTIIVGTQNYTNRQSAIIIGHDSSADKADSVTIGNNIYNGGPNAIVIGESASAGQSTADNSIAIGPNSYVNRNDMVALGSYATASSRGDLVLGTDSTSEGYLNDGPGSIVLGFGGVISSGSDVNIQMGSNATKATVSDASLYSYGETVTGSISGAVGRVFIKDITNNIIWIDVQSETDFQTGENLVGGTSLESQEITSIFVHNQDINNVRFNRGHNTVTIVNPLDITQISDTTESTSTTTGALVVNGGVGIEKELYIGNYLDLSVDSNNIETGLYIHNNSSLTKSSGQINYQEIYATISNNGGSGSTLDMYGSRIVLETTSSQSGLDDFYGLYISAYDTAGGLVRDSKGIHIDYINATTNDGTSATAKGIDINGGIEIYANAGTPTSQNAYGIHISNYIYVETGNAYGIRIDDGEVSNGGGGDTIGLYVGTVSNGGAGLDLSILSKGKVQIDDATTSTSTSTGALTVAGGVGISENLFVGNYLSASQGFTSTQTLGVNQTIVSGSAGNVLIGDNASLGIGISPASNCVVIGYEAYAEEDNCVVIGKGSYVDDENTIIIGTDVGTDRTNCILMGNNIYAGGNSNIFIGNNSQAFDIGTFESVGIGHDVYIEENNSVVIGYFAASSSDNDVVIGSASWTDLYDTDGDIVLGSHAMISSVGDNIDFQIGANMVKITVNDLTLYTDYETVTGGTSGATGVIEWKDATGGFLWIRMTSLTDFEVGDVLYGLTSGEAQTILTNDVIKNNIQDIRFNRGLETISIKNPLDVNNLILSGDTLRLTEPRTIASSGATGSIGEISWDENYIYIYVLEQIHGKEQV